MKCELRVESLKASKLQKTNVYPLLIRLHEIKFILLPTKPQSRFLTIFHRLDLFEKAVNRWQVPVTH